MLFQTIIAATITVASTLAAPVEVRSAGEFLPSATWSYMVRDGSISETSGALVDICKTTGNGGKDTTALFTFTYPEGSRNKQCHLEFLVDDTISVGGTKQLQLFSSNIPAPGPRESWGPGNQRNNHLATFSAAGTKSAVALTQRVPCKEPGTQEGFELVPTGDNDSITWNPSVSGAGLRIVFD